MSSVITFSLNDLLILFQSQYNNYLKESNELNIILFFENLIILNLMARYLYS